MAILTEKIFKIERPDSLTDPTAAAYEYFLNWYGTDGGFYVWMFTDFVEKHKVKGEIVSKNSDKINKIFESSENLTMLFCENLSENEYDVISKIVDSENLFRVFKDGSYQKLAIVTSDYSKRKSDFRYDFEIIVQSKNSKTYR